MQLDRDEYLLLSRRGSVPRARRSRRFPVPEGEPTALRQDRVRRAARIVGLRRATQRRARAADAYRAGVRATWTAFGRSSQDRFGGR